MIRATTGGVLRSYRSSLMNSFISLNKKRDTMLTQRNFNSYAEDVGSASRAFQMRRSLARVESQYAVNDDVYSKYATGYTVIDGLKDILTTRKTNSAWSDVLVSLNDPTGEARTALGTALDNLADSVVQSMNHKYGETFIFAGADGLNVPFEFNEAGVLCYRGVPVDTAANICDESITVNNKGEYDPAGDSYLLDNNVSVTSIKSVKTIYAVATDAQGKPLEVDATGTVVLGAPGTAAYAPKKLISIENYEHIKENYEHLQDTDTINNPGAGNTLDDINKPPELVKEADGTPIRLNKDGQVDPRGEYYLTFEGQTNDLGITYSPSVLLDTAGNPVTVDSTGKVDSTGDFYLAIDGDPKIITKDDYEQAKEDLEKLDYMSNKDGNGEKMFVDIGLGMKENEKGELIESSAFDAALQGVNFLGYGMDEDGDPKNIVSLLKQMANVCSTYYDDETWDAKDADGNPTNEHYLELDRLAGKLEDAINRMDVQYVDLTASSEKLLNNRELLKEEAYNLQEQISNVEDVDMAEAITSFLWAQYSYNAALRVGNSILSQSLMDYLG